MVNVYKKIETKSSFSKAIFWVFSANLLAGIGGYVILLISARNLESNYLVFTAFWSFLYLMIGAMSGLTPELTRTYTSGVGTPGDSESNINNPKTNLWIFCSVFGILAVLLEFLISIVIGPSIFGTGWQTYIFPLSVGIFFSIFYGGLLGLFYGAKKWKTLFFLISGDVVLRLGMISLASAKHFSLIGWVWVVVLPIPIIVIYGVIRAFLLPNKSRQLNIQYRKLAKNVFLTIAASTGVSLLVSGLPILIALQADQFGKEHAGEVAMALVVTRAPFVVGVLSLQTLLIVYFRNSGNVLPKMMKILMGLLVAGLLFSVFCYLIFPRFLRDVVGIQFESSDSLFGLLAVSAIPTGLLAVISAYALSLNRHFIYSFGWVFAAFVSSLIMFINMNLELKVLLSASIGPILSFVFVLVILSVNGGRQKFNPVNNSGTLNLGAGN